MNKSAIAVVLGLGLVATPLAHAKKRNDQAYVESFAESASIPVPVSVVSPVVSSDYIGTQVELTFVVDRTGKPVNITTTTTVNRKLATQLEKAVAQWRFAPAHNAAGKPAARKVVLPMHIVDGDANTRYAMQ